MLTEKSYVKYLESVVISLLAQRDEADEYADIPIVDPTSIMYGHEVCPINLRIEMRDQRKAREEAAD